MLLHIDPQIALVGLVVGFTVGLTGMGGGALTTPLLILVFRVPAVVAVGSDLVASVVMKLVGGGVHARAGTVQWPIVRRLTVAGVPGVLLGVVALQLVDPASVEALVRRAVGLALLAGAASMVLRSGRVRRRLLAVAPGRRPRAAALAAGTAPAAAPADEERAADARPAHEGPLVATLVLGGVVGFVVGLTSVGSGSLMVAVLAWLHPRLSTAQLVGTDLVQAFLLVTAGAVAHLGLGVVDFALAGSLLAGAVPGVLVGARLSAKAPDHLVRPALVAILATTGLKML